MEYGLMRDLINHDEAIYTAARDVIEQNIKAGLGVQGAVQGLQALMQDLFYDAYATMYEHLCRELKKDFPVNRSTLEWTRARITREEFDSMDWSALVYDLAEDLIDEHGLKAEKENN